MYLDDCRRLPDMQRRAAKFIRRILYARYVLASAVALAADLSSFLVLLQMKVPAVPASMVGYILGLGVHWVLSSRFVFAGKTAANAPERMRQKMMFMASALVGLAITAAIIEGGLQWGVGPSLAKLVAIGISFHATYILRRSIVFS
jgi:putative flippase GtrA